MSGKLAGKVAIITGGNDGIGEATALRFAEEGTRVVIMARREEEGLRVADDIRREDGDAIFVSCDVTNSESVRNAVASAVS
jgi:NAD(P)-dependent dehydrogenase (short-subunit alcohol dehydrogenase family)